MEYIRCKRYPALNHIHKRKDLDDAQKDRFHDLLNSLEYEEELTEDFLDVDLEHLRVMMPYYDKVEVESAKKVMSLFGGTTRYSTDYGEQKLFTRDYKNFSLQCYVDIFNRGNGINIIEAKATTTNKFLSLSYTENKIKFQIFYKDERGILHLEEERDPSLLSNKKYLKQRQKLIDRYSSSGIGVYVLDLAFQRFVIEEDIKDAKYYLAVLNHEYTFDGTYVDGEPLYNDDISCLVDLTTITKELLPKIEKDINVVIERIIEDDESRVHLGKHCELKKMRQCTYKDVCYDRFPEKNSILHYLDKHHGFKDQEGIKHEYFDLIEEGYYQMTDVPHEWLNRRNNQIQRDCAITHKEYFDLDKIRDGIQEIKYPIYHLDFESFPCPFPRFKGERPYMQSLFQFSIHIERSPGVCDKDRDHYEFLSKDHKDNRRQLVEQLCQIIKSDGGSVLVYNEAFEKTRIKELAQFYPEFTEQLNDINSRLFDLLHVVKTNSKLYKNLGYDEERAKTINYYNEDLVGSFSIKKVLPIFSNLTYKDMEVGNGMEAVYTYAGYKDFDLETLKQKHQALINYCKQDTWAMVEILKELRSI